MIAAIDPKVDVDTRNVQVRATLQNPQRKLLPGMFANINVDLGRPNNYITLPLTAISYNPYGSTVYIVVKADAEKKDGAKNTADKNAGDKTGGGLIVKQVFVTTGPKRGDQIAVLKGIAVGDEVVTSGQLKLKNNTAVVVNNTVQPANDPDPQPQEK